MKITTDVELETGGTTIGKLSEVTSISELQKVMLSSPYSLGTFKDNRVVKSNFISANSVALDFDENYTLNEAKKDFEKFQCIIATTKSHGKVKNGKVFDRFRVVLFFTEPITDNETFFSTYKKLQDAFPRLDPQCKNSSRWFYPSVDLIQVNKKGMKVTPVKLVTETKPFTSDSILQTKGNGKLAGSTKKLLKHGLVAGSRNGDTFKIAKDFQENGYAEDDAVKFILKAFTETNTLSYDFTEYEVENTIRSAYTSEPTNAPRKPFKLVPIKEIYRENKKLEWTVDKLLSKGGISLLSAAPKAGKSVIARQLITSILTNKKFFGRECLHGEVHYYAIEEQPEVIQDSFKKMDLPNDVPLYVHTGDIFSDDILRDFLNILQERKPVLAVVDTLFDFLDVESENNYKEVKQQLRKLRNIARVTGTHILCIHHANKGFGGVTGNHRSVLGSQAITGGVDSIMVVEMQGDTRVITTMGRSIKRWITRELIWKEETETYSLGGKIEIEGY